MITKKIIHLFLFCLFMFNVPGIEAGRKGPHNKQACSQCFRRSVKNSSLISPLKTKITSLKDKVRQKLAKKKSSKTIIISAAVPVFIFSAATLALITSLLVYKKKQGSNDLSNNNTGAIATKDPSKEKQETLPQDRISKSSDKTTDAATQANKVPQSDSSNLDKVVLDGHEETAVEHPAQVSHAGPSIAGNTMKAKSTTAKKGKVDLEEVKKLLVEYDEKPQERGSVRHSVLVKECDSLLNDLNNPDSGTVRINHVDPVSRPVSMALDADDAAKLLHSLNESGTLEVVSDDAPKTEDQMRREKLAKEAAFADVSKDPSEADRKDNVEVKEIHIGVRNHFQSDSEKENKALGDAFANTNPEEFYSHPVVQKAITTYSELQESALKIKGLKQKRLDLLQQNQNVKAIARQLRSEKSHFMNVYCEKTGKMNVLGTDQVIFDIPNRDE